MNTLDQQIDYLRKQLGIRDSQVLNDLLNCYSNAQISLQNQLVKQQQRIDKAIEELELWQPEIEALKIERDYLLDILRGKDDEDNNDTNNK